MRISVSSGLYTKEMSCLQGMFVGWAILSPLATREGWAAGPVRDTAAGARGWILWVALAIMCADAFVSLVPVAFESVQRVFIHRGTASEDYREGENETDDRLVPNSWVVVGLTLSVSVGTLLVSLVFGFEKIKPWASFVGFILGGMLSIIGSVVVLILASIFCS
jgi:uncharacterized oligopeptide transporter (OPT) family protein